MIYFKSAIAGIVALVVSTVLFPVLGILLYTLVTRPPAGTAIGWDPVSAAKSPTVWLVASAVFGAGFYWEFHRLTK
jgi:hypothetical protein